MMKIRDYISAALSYAGVTALVIAMLMPTNAELGPQDRYFISITFALSLMSILCIILKPINLKFTVQDLFAALLFVWLAASYFAISEINASTKWLHTAYLFVLYLNLRILTTCYKYIWNYLFALLLFCGLYEAILGIKQAMGLSVSNHQLFMVTGTFFNPGPYGGFVIVFMSAAFYYLVINYQRTSRFFKEKCWKNRSEVASAAMYVLCTASFFCSLIIIFSSGSRAALFGFAVCALLVIFSQKEIREKVKGYFSAHKKLSVLITVLAVIVVAAATFGIYKIKQDSADARLLTWRVMGCSISENPLTGTGFGSFEGEHAVSQAEYFTAHPDSRFIRVSDVSTYGFNEYLQLGTETGLPGLLLLIAILGISFMRLYRNKDPMAYGLLALMIFAFFSYPFTLISFQLLLLLFVCRSCCYEKGITVASRSLLATVCGLVIVLMIFVHPHYREKIDATKEWKESSFFYTSNNYEIAAPYYAELYPLLCDNPRFLFEYGHALNKTGDNVNSNAILEEGRRMSNDPMFLNIIGNNHKALGENEAAEKSYREAFKMLPNRLYPLYLLMNLYEESGQSTKAAEMARQIMDFEPKISSQATREMKSTAKRLIETY